MADYIPPNNTTNKVFLLSDYTFQDDKLTVAYANSNYAPRQATLNKLNNLETKTTNISYDGTNTTIDDNLTVNDILVEGKSLVYQIKYLQKHTTNIIYDDISERTIINDTLIVKDLYIDNDGISLLTQFRDLQKTATNISYDGTNTTIKNNIITKSINILNDCCIDGSTSIGISLAVNNNIATNNLLTNNITTNNLIVSKNVLIGGSLHHKNQLGVYLIINNIQYPLITSHDQTLLYGSLNLGNLQFTNVSFMILPSFRVDIYNLTHLISSLDNSQGDNILYQNVDIINIGKIILFCNNVFI